MKAIVFGASGYIGSHVCQALHKRGVDVTRSPAPRLPPSLLDDPDAREALAQELVDALEGHDVAVNCAGISDAGAPSNAELLLANAYLPEVLARAAMLATTPRFIHISSAAVQGRLEPLDSTKRYSPFSPYSHAKARGEALALAAGPAETVIYRPPGVHSASRGVTQRLVGFSRSWLASVSAPGEGNAPQALVENVADAVAFLATSEEVPPAIVHHPSERQTTSALLTNLSGRRPHNIPRWASRAIVRSATVLGRRNARLGMHARRLEVLWLGQGQAASWLDDVGWVPPAGPAQWKELGTELSQAPMSVAVVSTVHPRHDVRAFAKVAATLAKQSSLSVRAVVADGAGSDDSGDYPVLDVGATRGGRIGRAVVGGSRILRHLAFNRPDVVHVHSPEFLPFAVILTLLRVKLVYDVHEDLQKDIQDKYYIPRVMRAPLGRIAVGVQRFASRRASLIVAATESIAAPFANDRTVVVHNYPLLSDFPLPLESEGRSRGSNQVVHSANKEFVYLGALTEIRGLTQLVDALELAQSRAPLTLRLAGPPSPEAFLETLASRPGWKYASYVPFIPRREISEFLSGACAGIVTFLPEQNHVQSQPNKLFEYMAAGLPIVASNFPHWRALLEPIGCAVFVNPEDPADIAQGLLQIAADPRLARDMGRKGFHATRTKLNWEEDSKLLIDAYTRL